MWNSNPYKEIVTKSLTHVFSGITLKLDEVNNSW